MTNWSDEETDDPIHADRRNFYKVEQWSKDGMRVLDLVFGEPASTRPSDGSISRKDTCRCEETRRRFPVDRRT
jgi:hypothetical protein